MTRSLLVCFVLSTGLSGCAGIAQPERAGFISDYTQLQDVADDELFYAAGSLGQYDAFIVEPVALLLAQGDDENMAFTAEELAELQQYFTERLEKEISEDEGYAIVDAPGEGVARVRFGLTRVKRTIGVLNISLVTKITGAGIGGASAEGEILGSASGSRVLRAGITKSGDAKRSWQSIGGVAICVGPSMRRMGASRSGRPTAYRCLNSGPATLSATATPEERVFDACCVRHGVPGPAPGRRSIPG